MSFGGLGRVGNGMASLRRLAGGARVSQRIPLRGLALLWAPVIPLP